MELKMELVEQPSFVSKVGTAIKTGVDCLGVAAAGMLGTGMLGASAGFFLGEIFAMQQQLYYHSGYGQVLTNAGKDLICNYAGQGFMAGAAIAGVSILAITSYKAASYLNENHTLNGFIDALDENLTDFMYNHMRTSEQKKYDAEQEKFDAQKSKPTTFAESLDAQRQATNDEIAKKESSIQKLKAVSQDLTKKLSEIKSRREGGKPPTPDVSATTKIKLSL